MNKPLQAHMIIFKDVHDNMIVQVPMNVPDILWIGQNFPAILQKIFIDYPPIKEYFEKGIICGWEVQLL